MTYFALPLSIIEKTKHIHALDVDLLQYKYRKPRLVQMPEAVTGCVLCKRVFFKFSQNLQETSVPEETLLNFAKFLGTPFFTEQLRTTASEMRASHK